MIDWSQPIEFKESVPAVGYYEFSGVQLHVTRRPNRFQRLMTRWFFGWKWFDA